MKKFIITLVSFFTIFAGTAHAGLKADISNVINTSGINRGSISISVKNANTGKSVYELNPRTPISPASTQKILTATTAFMTLGDDYKFSTKLYRNSNNEYTLKLGADPYLTSKDLDKIVKFIPKEQNAVNIDATIIDDNEWGEGWQWDDDLNPLMPKFSAYNLDKNLMEITISPGMRGYPAEITQNVEYPITYINKTVTDKVTKYTIKRQNQISPDILLIDGKIQYDKSAIVNIPINNPKKYFKMRLSEAIINQGISCSGIYKDVKVKDNDKLISLLSHSISTAKKDIYKNSNNMVSETVFKIAGGVKSNCTGSFKNGLEMFNQFCREHSLDTTGIKLVDASGVSKNNLMTADFMTEFLLKVQGYLEPELPTAGEGTLSNRMLYLKGFIHAKTGTLNNISAIAGYITTKKNQRYTFCIMINNPEVSPGNKKMFEEYILRTIYTKG